MAHPITILDGGLGRELARRGAPFKQPEWSALAMIEAPEQVQAVHQDFINSGAQVIATNSYALVPFHIGDERFKEQGPALIRRSGEVARAAALGTQVQVAGSLPPLFGSYRPDLFDVSHVRNIAMPLIDNLAEFVDLWQLETQSLIAETQAVLALLPSDDKPRWVSFTLDDNTLHDTPRLRSGESVENAVKAMLDCHVQSILFNCCQPEVILAAIEQANRVLEEQAASDTVRLGGYGNAFVSAQAENATANEGLDDIRQDLTPQAYLHFAQQWRAAGASVIGGCCGIGPEHIALLSRELH
ncbi:homocysteine S-methyltransferase family protein [Celerinatantimonas yamalensis]|uniref:Homocysteine S-methyltransferase family protein n=1 Tax=Celerinatantimonas yamalensis TaxID=559956 RepID=A0ABW9G2Z3_9GAMM